MARAHRYCVDNVLKSVMRVELISTILDCVETISESTLFCDAKVSVFWHDSVSVSLVFFMVLPSTIVLASGVFDNGCTEAIVQREIIYVGERVYNITFCSGSRCSKF
jgi:lysophospholipid acyltransferase (LPLAT)-like uncharacterized protein